LTIALLLGVGGVTIATSAGAGSCMTTCSGSGGMRTCYTTCY
jgi:hypothetical protein